MYVEVEDIEKLGVNRDKLLDMEGEMAIIICDYLIIKAYKKKYYDKIDDVELKNKIDMIIKGFELYIKWCFNVDGIQDGCTCDEYFCMEDDYVLGVKYSMTLLNTILLDLN
jgi:hypothetical protein